MAGVTAAEATARLGFGVRQWAEAIGSGRDCDGEQGGGELSLSIMVTLTAARRETRGRQDAVINRLCCRKRYAPRGGHVAMLP
jgi:hypothetical protein